MVWAGRHLHVTSRAGEDLGLDMQIETNSIDYLKGGDQLKQLFCSLVCFAEKKIAGPGGSSQPFHV